MDFSSYPDYFVGEGEIYIKTSESYDGDPAEELYSFDGAIVSDGELVKMQCMLSQEGLELPMIFWSQSGKEYLELPTLFPGELYSADDFASEELLPFEENGINISGFDFPREVFDVLEKELKPEETMTFSDDGDTQTYRLEMDTRKASTLFKELNILLNAHGVSDLMDGENSIIGQLSATTVASESHDCDAGFVEITSDGESYLLFKIGALRSEKTANQLIINVTYTQDTKSYTVTYSPKLSDKVKLSSSVSGDKLTLKGEYVASAQKNKYDLTILAVGENEYTIDGTISYSMGPDGSMIPVSYVIKGAFTETEERIAFQMGISLSMMGGYVKIETGYDIRYKDVTLEFPFAPEDIKEFDPEEFYQRMMEVYPEVFEGLTTEFQLFLAEDESAMLILYSDGSGDLSCQGTYKKDGSDIKITILDGFVMEGCLTVSGNKYFLNGHALEVEKEDGIISLFYGAENGSYPWGVYLYDDGTCDFFSAFYLTEDGDGYVFEDGTPLSGDAFVVADDLTVRFLGKKFIYMPGEFGEEL